MDGLSLQDGRLKAACLACDAVERKLRIVGDSIDGVGSGFAKQSLEEIGLQVVLIRDSLCMARSGFSSDRGL